MSTNTAEQKTTKTFPQLTITHCKVTWDSLGAKKKQGQYLQFTSLKHFYLMLDIIHALKIGIFKYMLCTIPA